MQTSIHSLRTRLGVVLILTLALVVEAKLNGQDQKIESGDQNAKQTQQPATEIQELTKKQLDALQVQMDAKGPIFLYDQSGGFRVARPTKQTPDFQLFADGTLVVGGTNFGMPKLESKLTDAELTKFLHFVVNENGFYELDEKEIEKQMLAGKEKVKLMDAPTTRFAINLQRGKKGISVYALWNAVKNYPDIEELRRLSRIENRCKMLISKIHLGDDGEKVLKAVNEAVAKLEQKIAPFTLEELQNATRLTTGRFQVRFERELPPEKTANNESTPPRKLNAIYFRSDAKSEPKVSFYGLPRK